MYTRGSGRLRRLSTDVFPSTRHKRCSVYLGLRLPDVINCQLPPQVIQPYTTCSGLRMTSSSNSSSTAGAHKCHNEPATDPVSVGEIFERAVKSHLSSHTDSASTSSATIKCNEHISVELSLHKARDLTMYINISNTKKGNSLNRRLIEDLTEVFRIVMKLTPLRCIVLAGEPNPSASKQPAFCSGANLHEMSQLNTVEEAEMFIGKLSKLCSAVSDCPVPTIGAIDGYCFGAGMELAACCDVRFATEKSTFAMPEVKVGIPSVIQARHLVDIMGWPNARYLMLFGKAIDGSEAKRQGYINELFPDRQSMMGKIEEEIGSLLELGPTAVRTQKSLLKQWKTMDADAGIDASVKAFGNMWSDGGQEPKQYMAMALESIKKRREAK